MLPKEALVSLYYNAYTIQIETFDLRLGNHIKGIMMIQFYSRNEGFSLISTWTMHMQIVLT